MKKLFYLLTVAGILFWCGCYSASELERKPAPRRYRPAAKKTFRPKAKDDRTDPAFELIFKSKPQKHDSGSLSAGESSYLEKQRQEDDAAMRSVRGKNRLRENTRQKDWVFGTEGGKYF